MYKIFYIIVGLCLTILGCTKEKPTEEINGVPLTISPQLKYVNTKAIIDESTIRLDSIRIQVANESSGGPYSADAFSILRFSSPNWILSKSLYLTLDNAQIYAYAPCPADPSTIESGELANLQIKLDIPAIQRMSDQTDYLYAFQQYKSKDVMTKINSKNPTVELALRHALTQVAFVFYEIDYLGAGNISSVKIKDISASSFRINSTLGDDLVMKVKDGSITGGDFTNEIQVTNIDSTIRLTSKPLTTDVFELAKEVNAYLLLTPVTINQEDIEFTFNIDGRDYVSTLGTTGSLNWQMGYQYIYTVKLEGTALVIQSVTVIPWTSTFK